MSALPTALSMMTRSPDGGDGSLFFEKIVAVDFSTTAINLNRKRHLAADSAQDGSFSTIEWLVIDVVGEISADDLDLNHPSLLTRPNETARKRFPLSTSFGLSAFDLVIDAGVLDCFLCARLQSTPADTSPTADQFHVLKILNFIEDIRSVMKNPNPTPR
jgi:hypothetical protein